ncbi:MAG: NUDIX domain-containing protein, partial [Bacteroidales bacterium]
YIELLKSKPGNLMPDEQVIEYTSFKQLKKAFQVFEEDDHQMKLVFWSEKEDISLKRDFFHLFKRVDAAGGLVKNEKEEMLFIFRLGKWDLPKGKLTENETLEKAAIREVKEETGLLELRITGSLPSTFHIYTRKGKQILKQTYWFEMEAKSAQSLIPQTEEDISEVRWVGKEDLKAVLSNTYGSIRELVSS